MPTSEANPIRTVGHGTLGAEEMLSLLHGAGISSLIDIRRYPGSRRNPQYGADELSRWLPDDGIGYQRIEALGGRRKPSPDSPNTAWRNAQFAAYADWMATDEFAEGISALLEVADDSPTAVMCSESVWWRCHRRMVADHLMLIEQRTVEHLFHDGRLVEHVPLDESQVVDGEAVDRHVEYPAAQGELPL